MQKPPKLPPLPANPDMKEWARRLKRAEEAGLELLPVQERAWRVALREGLAKPAKPVAY